MAATDFQIPADWFQGREEIYLGDLKKVVPKQPNGTRVEDDTLLTILSESIMQLQHQGPLEFKRLNISGVVTARGLKAIASVVNVGLLGKLQSIRIGRIAINAFAYGYLGADAMAIVAEMLFYGKIPALQELCVEGFDLSNTDSFNSFAQALRYSQLYDLCQLHLPHNLLTNNSIVEILLALEYGKVIDPGSNLEELELAQNRFGVNVSTANFEAQKLAKIHNLKDLGFQFNSLGDEGAIIIAEAMKSGKMSNLESLDLAYNHVVDKGILALVKAVESRKTTSLHTLNLEGCDIPERDGCPLFRLWRNLLFNRLSNVWV